VGEVLGARSVIYIKDEDGLYTSDPKKDPSAQHISSIEASELLARNMPEMVIEKVVVQTLVNARHMKQIQVINGLKRGLLARALKGEPVGTIIYAGAENHPKNGLWIGERRKNKSQKATKRVAKKPARRSR